MGKRQSAPRLMAIPVIVMVWLMISPAVLCCANGGSECKECIENQMKLECPKCSPPLHCMARCLWGGTAKPNCVKKCQCGSATPKLSICKKCMSKCKCSCMVY